MLLSTLLIYHSHNHHSQELPMSFSSFLWWCSEVAVTWPCNSWPCPTDSCDAVTLKWNKFGFKFQRTSNCKKKLKKKNVFSFSIVLYLPRYVQRNQVLLPLPLLSSVNVPSLSSFSLLCPCPDESVLLWPCTSSCPWSTDLCRTRRSQNVITPERKNENIVFIV